MTFTTRTATENDIAALSQLAITSFCETFGHLYIEANLQSHIDEKCSQRFFADAFARGNSVMRVAENAAGEMIGYSKFGALEVPAPDFITPNVELHRLYVDAAYKGQGVGGALMQEFIDAGNARDAAALYIGVYSENPSAIAFYTTHGFTKTAEYDYLVGTQIDREHIMVRVLRSKY